MLLARCSDGYAVDLPGLQYCVRVRVRDCDETLEAVEFDLPHDGGGVESVRVMWRERELSRFCSLYRGMVDEVW
jgi:hypothetical protein